MPNFNNIESGVHALKEIANAAQDPLVGGITNVVHLIIQCVTENEKTNRDYERVVQRVLDISISCAKVLAELRDKSGMAFAVGQLIRALEHIAITLQRTFDRGKVTRMLSSSKYLSTIKGAEMELESAVSVFSFHLESINTRLSTKIEMNAQVTSSEVSSVLDQHLQEQSTLLRSKLAKSHRQLRGSGYLPMIHPAPPIFFGRELQKEHLIASLCSQDAAFIAILGPGGIGKTSLALTALHHPKVAEEYGQYRYFISCESCINAEGLSATIALLFDLHEKKLVPELRKLLEAADLKVIFILDNFETPWESFTTRSGVESLLCELAGIPRLSLLLTLRGSERPSGIAWTRPFLPPLTTLDISAARQTFISISDVSEREEKLDELLNAVDRVPLAVTLMAAQAQHTACATLLDRWCSEKTSSVSRGYEGRLSSLDTSIRVSLNSSRFASCPDAAVLLQLLSLLPDGLDVAEIENVTSSDFSSFSALAVLRQVALADQDATSRLYSLSPIREYVKACMPIEGSRLMRVFEYHQKLALHAKSSQYTSERASMVAALARQIGNIHSVLLYSMESDSLVDGSIRAIVNMTGFHLAAFHGAIPAVIELAYQKAKAKGLKGLQASCLVARAKVLGYSNQHESLDTALTIFREVSDNDGIADTLLSYARMHEVQAEWGKAVEKLREMFLVLSPDSSPELRAQAFHWLSINLSYQLLVPEAIGAAKTGLNSIDTNKFPILASNLHYAIAICYCMRGLFSRAIQFAQRAVGLLVDGDKNKGSCCFILSGSLVLQSRIEEARIAAEYAYKTFANLGRTRDMASVQELLGQIHIYRSDFESAVRCLSLALRTYTSLGMKNKIATCTVIFGDIEFFQGSLTTSWEYYNYGQKLLRELNWIGEAQSMSVLFGMGDILFRAGETSSSLSISVTVALIASRKSGRLTTGMGVQRIGDVFARMGDFASAKSCYDATWHWIRYLGARRHMGDCLLRLAVVALLQGECQETEALSLLNRARKCFLAAEYNVGAQYCQDRLDKIQSGMKETEFPPLPYATLISP